MTDMFSTRGSVGQFYLQQKFFYDEKPEICKLFPNHKPFLILVKAQGREAIFKGEIAHPESYPREKMFLEKAKKIAEKDGIEVYELPFEVACN